MRGRWSSRSLAVCAAAAVMLLTGCGGKEEKLRAQVDAQAKQLAVLQEANVALQSRLDEANGRFDAADARLKQASAKAEEEAADPYTARTENDLLVDKRIPSAAVGLLLKLVETVHAKPEADDKVWAQLFHDPERMINFIRAVLAMPDLAYGKLFYQGQTTFEKPGKTTVSMVVVAKLKTGAVHAYALTDTNREGWKIADVD